jgi:hypothetical protein
MQCTELHSACSDAYKIPCQSGFVWREALPGDYVCVNETQRKQAQADNREERRRRRDYEAVLH